MEALVDCATQRLPIPQVQYNCRHGRQFDEIYDQRARRDVDGVLGKDRTSNLHVLILLMPWRKQRSRKMEVR
jgi:hypothetical protein